MLPLKNLELKSYHPVCTYALIFANILIFIIDRVSGDLIHHATQHGQANYTVLSHLNKFGLTPAHFITAPVLQFYTIFTSMFFHGDWLHLLSNMVFLNAFGTSLEKDLGWTKYMFFYLFCGFVAAMIQTISNPTSEYPMVGASGAIAGIMGAYMFLYPKTMIRVLFPILFYFIYINIPAVIVIAYWLALQGMSIMFIGKGLQVTAYYAHLGGFFVGMMSMIIFTKINKKKEISHA
jgi:membrane associated rhomboid family serine protease